MADKAIASASLLLFCDNKKFMKGVNETRKKWEGFTKNIDSINKKYFNNSKFGQGLSSAMTRITPVVSALGAALSVLASILAEIAKLAAKVALAFGAGVMGIAAYSVKASESLSKLKKQWKGSGGTQEGFDYMKRIASGNPNLSLATALEAGSAFVRMGKTEAEAGNAVNILANATAKFGKGKEAIGLILTQMEQLNGKTSGFTGDLNAIQNSLPDVKQKIMEIFGVKSIDALSSKKYNGKKITGAMINDAIIQAYSDVPTMEPGISDLAGNVKDQFDSIMASIGDNLVPVIKEIIYYVQAFVEYWEAHSGEIIANLKYIWDTYIAKGRTLWQVLEDVAKAVDQFIQVCTQLLDVIYPVAKGIGNNISGDMQAVHNLQENDVGSIYRGAKHFTDKASRIINPAYGLALDAWGFTKGLFSGEDMFKDFRKNTTPVTDSYIVIRDNLLTSDALKGTQENYIKSANERMAREQKLGIYAEGYKNASGIKDSAGVLEEMNQNIKDMKENTSRLVNQGQYAQTNAISVR